MVETREELKAVRGAPKVVPTPEPTKPPEETKPKSDEYRSMAEYEDVLKSKPAPPPPPKPDEYRSMAEHVDVLKSIPSPAGEEPSPEPLPPSHGTFEIKSGIIISDPERHPDLLKENFAEGSIVQFGNRSAIITKTGEVKFYDTATLKKKLETLNWTEAIRLGLVTEEEYEKAKEYAKEEAEASAIKGYETYEERVELGKKFAEKKRTFETMYRTDPVEAVEWALDVELINREQYNEMLPKAKEDEKKLEEAKMYIISFQDYGTEVTKTFRTQEAANAYVDSLKKEQMDRAGWKGTWSEFEDHVERQKEAVSKLIAKGTAELTAGGQVKLTKPVTVLTDEEIRDARDAGFDIPELPEAPSWMFYRWGEEQFAERSFAQSQTEYYSALLGNIEQTIVAPYQWLMSAVPGEQWGEKPLKAVTTGTIKYLEDLTPAQQIALDVGGLAAEVGAVYLESIAVGFTAKGTTLAAKGIASKLGITAPKAIAKIGTLIATHPKIAQAIVWAPIAGMEAHNVYQDIQAGKPVEEIIKEEARRIALMYAGLKGLQAGWKLLPASKMEKLTRLIQLEEIRTPEGTRIVPTLKTKDIPKDIADLIKTELDPITGKEIVVGWGVEGGARVPIAREYGDLLGKLVEGKAVGPEAVKGAIVSAVGEKGYGILVAKGLNIEMMSAQEIAKLMFKELGYGTPWYTPVTEWTMGGGKIDVIGVMQPLEGDALTASINKTRDLYQHLLSQGMSVSQASKWAAEIAMESPTKLVWLGREAGLSDSMIQTIVSASLTYGSTTTGGTLLNQILTKQGVSGKEISAIVSMMVQAYEPENIVKNLPKLSTKSIGLIIKQIDIPTLTVAIPKLDSSTLKKTLPHLDAKVLTNVLPSLRADDIVAVVPSLSTETVTAVLPKLSLEQLPQVIPKLDNATITALIPELTPTQIAAIIPELSQSQLTLVLQIPGLDVNLITSLLPSVLSGMLTGYPSGKLEAVIGRVKRGIEEANRELKEIKPTRFLQPYKVTFMYYVAGSEAHRVHARSFNDAIRLGFKLKKKTDEPEEVEVRKLMRR